MNTPERRIFPIEDAATPRPTPPVCSVDQIHQALSLAVRDERRVEATISEIRDRDGTIWLGMTQAMADTRVARSLSGRVDRGARASLDDAVGGTFGRDHLGSTIVADVRIGLALDGRIKTTVTNVVQVCETTSQRATAIVLGDLQADGVVDRQRALREPDVVESVAVICPPASAGRADVAEILGRLFGDWRVDITWLTATFEGNDAEDAVAAALTGASELAARGAVDLVLVVRGGGTPAALAYLDSERLARLVADVSVPVITGLGHADNRTLLDEVSWHAAATPTDAAQMVIKLRAAVQRAQEPSCSRSEPIQTPPPRPAPEQRPEKEDGHVSSDGARRFTATPGPIVLHGPIPPTLPRKPLGGATGQHSEQPAFVHPRVLIFSSDTEVRTAEQARSVGAMSLVFPDGMLGVRADPDLRY